MAKVDYTWGLLFGGLAALYFGTRKKTKPVEPELPETVDAPEPDPDPGFGASLITAYGPLDFDDCLTGWDDAALRSLMEDRETEITWEGEDADEKTFLLAQLILAELCPQLREPETLADARSSDDLVFLAVWERLMGIAWKVARNWPA